MNQKVTVYQAGGNQGWGFRVWRGMFRELWVSRELVWRLFLRDFSARYRQTVLGVAWAVILPAVMVGTFLLLNRSGIIQMGALSAPYPVYALVGLTIWQIFAGGITSASNSIVAGGTMAAKINFPKESLVLSALGQTAVDTLVRAGLTAGALLYYGWMPPAGALAVPLLLLPVILFTVGLGFILSLANALFRDVANIISVLTQFLLFLTPILYPAPTSGPLERFGRFNPLVHLVAAPRDLFVTGQLPDPAGCAVMAVISLVLFLVCWRLFHLAEPRMMERMGSR